MSWVDFLVMVAVVLTLELVFWGLRRWQKSFRGGFLFHLWAILIAAFVVFEGSPWAARDGTLWQVLCTGTVVLSVIVLFGLLDAFLVVRPLDPKAVHQEGRYLVPRLLYNVVRFLSVVASGIFALTAIHEVPLPTVLVSSTVVSAVLGLALQDVLKNVFAGVSMELEGRIKEGDWLSFDGQPAIVESMSWRSTQLRTNLGVRLVEPNATLADRRLLSYGSGRRPVAFSFKVGLPYEAPPADCRAALLRAAQAVDSVLPQPPPQALLSHYGDHAIDFDLRVWTRDVQQIEVFASQVRTRIWYELQRAGLYVPFPIRTMHMYQMDTQEARQKEEQTDRLSSQLAKVDLFADLEPEALRRLAECARPLDFDDGEALTREGDPGDSLFVLDRGRVMVSKSGQRIGTGSVQLASLGPGDVFGEMSLLTGEERSATVRADGSCRVLVLSKDALAPLMQSEPALAETFSRILAQRKAANVATFEARQKAPPSPDSLSGESQTLLRRIRRFFRLA